MEIGIEVSREIGIGIGAGIEIEIGIGIKSKDTYRDWFYR